MVKVICVNGTPGNGAWGFSFGGLVIKKLGYYKTKDGSKAKVLEIDKSIHKAFGWVDHGNYNKLSCSWNIHSGQWLGDIERPINIIGVWGNNEK